MKIGILQTGHAPDELKPDLGNYDAMFAQLLAGHDFEFITWPVVDGIFPSSIHDADGWLITGSKHGAYEDHAWIPPLEDLIRDIHAAGLPLIGICFGHQIIAQAMGGKVEKFTGGWAVGRQTYDFEGKETALNAWHQDQVTQRPEGATVVARNAFCENAALLYGDKVFTVQAHPEFHASFIDGLLRTRAPGLVPDELQEEARQNLQNPVATQDLADKMALFFKEKRIS